MFAIDEGASFVVDDSVNAKETRRVGKSAALKEIHRVWFLEHKVVDFVWVDKSRLASLHRPIFRVTNAAPGAQRALR